MVFIRHVKIIKVSAYSLGGIHVGINLELLMFRQKILGKGSELNALGNGKLCGYPFLFCRYPGQIFYVRLQVVRHIIEAVRQLLDFIACLD